MHPLTLQNTSLIFLRLFLVEQTRLRTGDTKGRATQGNSTRRAGMAGLLTGAPNDNIVQNHLNIALLNVF